MQPRAGESGVSGVETGLLLLLVLVCAYAAVMFFGGELRDDYESVPGAFEGEVVTMESPGESGGGGSGSAETGCDEDDPEPLPVHCTLPPGLDPPIGETPDGAR